MGNGNKSDPRQRVDWFSLIEYVMLAAALVTSHLCVGRHVDRQVDRRIGGIGFVTKPTS